MLNSKPKYTVHSSSVFLDHNKPEKNVHKDLHMNVHSTIIHNSLQTGNKPNVHQVMEISEEEKEIRDSNWRK